MTDYRYGHYSADCYMRDEWHLTDAECRLTLRNAGIHAPYAYTFGINGVDYSVKRADFNDDGLHVYAFTRTVTAPSVKPGLAVLRKLSAAYRAFREA